MIMNDDFATIVLCGGFGNRLWPLSRDNCPKQFIEDRFCSGSLFQHTVKRVDSLNCGKIIIIGSQAHRFHIEQQLNDIGRL